MAKKILLIEDNLFISDLYRRVLSQADYEVLTALDGQEGLQQAKKIPDLILLDIMLPKINGLDVLRKLKQDPTTAKIPVILLTNLGQETIIREAFYQGAQGYLMKCRLTPYEIIEAIKRFLQNPSLKMDLNQLDLE